MKYTIETIQVKNIASLGKNVAETALKEVGTNNVTEKVQIWQEFPNFDGLTFGTLVEGDIVEKENSKGYKNITLYAPKAPFKAGEGRGAQMNKAMEKKTESIKLSQDRKEAGIETSSTFRDATILTAEFIRASGKTWTLEQTREIWIKNRKWLLHAYSDYAYGQPKMTSPDPETGDEINPDDIPF